MDSCVAMTMNDRCSGIMALNPDKLWTTGIRIIQLLCLCYMYLNNNLLDLNLQSNLICCVTFTEK